MNADMTKILQEIAVALRAFLGRTLPGIRTDWWAALVIASLSEQQQRNLRNRRSESLDGLDLAALLRVFNFNFDDIAQRENCPRDLRTWLKEMQGIRNRYAHASAEPAPIDDQWRDLDTAQRFAASINAPQNLLDTIANLKTTLLQPKQSLPQAGDSAPPEAANRTELAPGDEVILKSDPTKTGYVVQVLPSTPENRYVAIIDGKKVTCYASQLERPSQPARSRQVVSLDTFNAHLAALQIRFPATSSLYSLNSARIDFIPYQFRPVLKFIHADRPRLLIADSVGVGKTIEAGLILRELQARREVRSVLIICPRALITERKWQTEMRRFDEQFNHLDGDNLRQCLDHMDLEGAWPEQFAKGIIPYSLLDESLLYGTWRGNRQAVKGLLDLDPPPHFDLVIVDEAHRIRNPETFTHKAVRFFCDNAEAVVFLTATPIQLASQDLFVLLNTLRPDLVIDQPTFNHMTEPNGFINEAVAHARSSAPDWQDSARAALENAAATSWGQAILKPSPDFQKVIADLRTPQLAADRRVAMVRQIEEFHSLSRLLNRTRRRDIGEFTVRKPETVTTPFTEEQRELHDKILATQAQILLALHGNANFAFMMSTIRRQTASCIFGLVPMLSDILTRRLGEIRGEGDDDDDLKFDETFLQSLDQQIREVLDFAKRLPPKDNKLEALMTVLRQKQSQPTNKVMLFSTFRHTLAYLLEKLTVAAFRVGCIHGDTDDIERRTLRERFKRSKEDPEALDVLLFSEVGSEGLDYQFCDCMVNYDLPWNPMKIEQRIGRIDRKGQKSPSVLIYNLITPGTVDAEIYERCLLRIGVFSKSIGGSEEILGSITAQIGQVADNFALSPEQQREKLQVIADNQIRLLQAQQELEEKQLELFGIKVPDGQPDAELKAATSYWLSPQALETLVRLYLGREPGGDQTLLLGDQEAKTLRASAEARTRLLRDFQQLPRQRSLMFQRWENWLKGTNQHLPATFAPAFAQESPEHALLSLVHPLIRQAAHSLAQTDPISTALRVSDSGLPPGKHPFAIYCWHQRGTREELIFQPVCLSGPVQKKFTELLAGASSLAALPGDFEEAQVVELEVKHHAMWQKARQDHQAHASRVAAFQRESLKTSHAARLALLREQLAQATDDRIRRMRQSQIETAELDYQRHLQDIDLAIARADIIAEEVACGVIFVES